MNETLLRVGWRAPLAIFAAVLFGVAGGLVVAAVAWSWVALPSASSSQDPPMEGTAMTACSAAKRADGGVELKASGTFVNASNETQDFTVSVDFEGEMIGTGDSATVKAAKPGVATPFTVTALNSGGEASRFLNGVNCRVSELSGGAE
ncbi:hypothetical protein ACIBG8_53820 [Nonomuraea sp. NPDC050556]|uniref:hypothetical protein n=1 Tax=Nonomuraea sp. NPDC050556 TaxID=3364369 RepID=UPI00378F4DD6